MPANKPFLLFITSAILLVVFTGCGGGTSLSFPTPQGSFSASSLNGPFAFSYTGTDGGGFLAVAGSLQFDGAGHITSGIQDINSGLGINTSVATTGTYTVRADGRGSATLNAASGNSTIDFVIAAGGHALITRFDNAATGSGTLDQQTTSAFSNAALAGSFAFSISGIDAGGNPLAVAGNFTSDAAGNITGIDDSNDAGTALTNDPLTGTIPVAANGRGTATLNTGRGALTFAYYVVDATHLKLAEVDTQFALGGDAFRQTGPFSNASISGSSAFTIAGADNLAGGPFAGGGVLTTDGAGNISPNSVADFNDVGTLNANINFAGTYTVAANGRGTLSMVTTPLGTLNFIVYPSSGGLLMLETDVRFATGGTALQQTTPLSNASLSGTYGLNFTGVGTNGEIDSIAEFTADGASKVSGIIDLNNTGAVTFGQPLSGTFSVTSSGRATLTATTPLGTQNLVLYVVNGNRALFVEMDTALVAAGDIRHQ